MMIIYGSLAAIGSLVWSSTKKESIAVKKETQLRLVLLLIIGLSINYFSKPDEGVLYRTIINDFNIERVYQPEKSEKELKTMVFNNFMRTMNITFITEDEKIDLSENPQKLTANNTYFIITEPAFNEKKSKANFHITYECGKECSFSADYTYEVKNKRWVQAFEKNLINW